MANSEADSSRFAEIFLEITDQSTITDSQQIEVPVRVDNLIEEQNIAAYLDEIPRADGLEDVITEPESIE